MAFTNTHSGRRAADAHRLPPRPACRCRSRWNASNSESWLRKPPDGSGNSTRCGKSRSFWCPVISPLGRVTLVEPSVAPTRARASNSAPLLRHGSVERRHAARWAVGCSGSEKATREPSRMAFRMNCRVLRFRSSLSEHVTKGDAKTVPAQPTASGGNVRSVNDGACRPCCESPPRVGQ
jgi:hypothetical protein